MSLFVTDQTDSAVTDAVEEGDTSDSRPTKNAAEETFDTSKTFADLGLPKDVLDGITKSGFEHPTKIQAKVHEGKLKIPQ